MKASYWTLLRSFIADLDSNLVSLTNPKEEDPFKAIEMVLTPKVIALLYKGPLDQIKNHIDLDDTTINAILNRLFTLGMISKDPNVIETARNLLKNIIDSGGMDRVFVSLIFRPARVLGRLRTKEVFSRGPLFIQPEQLKKLYFDKVNNRYQREMNNISQNRLLPAY